MIMIDDLAADGPSDGHNTGKEDQWLDKQSSTSLPKFFLDFSFHVWNINLKVRIYTQ